MFVCLWYGLGILYYVTLNSYTEQSVTLLFEFNIQNYELIFKYLLTDILFEGLTKCRLRYICPSCLHVVYLQYLKQHFYNLQILIFLNEKSSSTYFTLLMLKSTICFKKRLKSTTFSKNLFFESLNLQIKQASSLQTTSLRV